MRCGFGVWWCSGGDVAWVMGCRFCLIVVVVVVVVVVCMCFFFFSWWWCGFCG